MIKINLLPVKRTQLREKMKREVAIFVLIALAVVMGLKYHYEQQKKIIDQVRYRVSKVEDELKSLSGVGKKLAKVKKSKINLEKKLEIIKKLRITDYYPPKVLQQISELIPKKVWLKGIVQEESKVLLTGSATSNEEIGVFMTKLEKSGYFSEVDLVFTDAGLPAAKGEVKQEANEGIGFEIRAKFEG